MSFFLPSCDKKFMPAAFGIVKIFQMITYWIFEPLTPTYIIIVRI